MTQVFLTVFNLSIAACWLIAAVLLVRLLFGKRMPKWICCCLWGLVAIRLLVPFTVESNISLVPNSRLEIMSEQASTDNLLQDQVIGIQQGSEVSTSVIPEYSQEQSAPAAENEFVADTSGVYIDTDSAAPIVSAPVIPAPENEPLTETTVAESAEERGVISKKTAGILGIVWAVGVAVMLVYWLTTYILLKKRVMLSIPCGDRVRKGECIESPVVFGLFRPRIYIPFGLSAQTEECVIAHERAHLKRRDHLVKPFGFFVLSIYWFNPLVWVAYILLCRDIEYACDEKVINDLPHEERKAYAYALLECAVAHKRISACPVAFGETGVKERVENTMKYKKPAFWLMLLSVFLCVMVAALFLTTSAGESGASYDSSEQISEITEESLEASTDESSEAAPEESGPIEYDDPDYRRPLYYVDGLFDVRLLEYADISGDDDFIRLESDNESDSNVLIRPKTEIYDLEIFSVPFEHILKAEVAVGDIIYRVDKVTADKPLIASFFVHDRYIVSGFSFADASGQRYYYHLILSTVDGRLYNGRFYPEQEEESKPPEAEQPDVEINLLGNKNGNSRVAKQSDTYYYADGEYITAITDNGNHAKRVLQLSNGYIYNLNVVGEWMYFSVEEVGGIENGYIAKARTDGSGFTKLLQVGNVYEMLVVKDTIYFIPVWSYSYSNVRDGALYSMSVNGGTITEVHASWVSSLWADENYIYFVYQDLYEPMPTNICRINHDGLGKRVIWKADNYITVNYIAVDDSRVYFGTFDGDDSSKFKFASVDNNGNGYTEHGAIENYSYMIDVSDGKLYFQGHDFYYGEMPMYSDREPDPITNEYTLFEWGVIEMDLATKELTHLHDNAYESDFYVDNGLVFVPENYSVSVIDRTSGETHKISVK